MADNTIPCRLETKVSKNGNEYRCLVIQLCDDYQKVVFLDKAEESLIKIVYNNK